MKIRRRGWPYTHFRLDFEPEMIEGDQFVAYANLVCTRCKTHVASIQSPVPLSVVMDFGDTHRCLK